MSLRHRLFYSTIARPFGRKLSGPLDRGWGDTVVGPLEAPREGDPGDPSSPDANSSGKPEEDGTRGK
jgi:hypothetical protein